MSTTTAKRTWRQALDDAEALRALFPTDSYQRWEIAGSTRRRAAQVGDVEHVIIPAHGEVTLTSDLFACTTRVSLLWHHLVTMLCEGELAKHAYGETDTGGPLYRWGDKYRGVDFRGFGHELFTADADNWGAILAIRTGPSHLSRRLVTDCQSHGWRMADGYLRRATTGAVEQVTEEADFFALCGMSFVKPEDRR